MISSSVLANVGNFIQFDLGFHETREHEKCVALEECPQLTPNKSLDQMACSGYIWIHIFCGNAAWATSDVATSFISNPLWIRRTGEFAPVPHNLEVRSLAGSTMGGMIPGEVQGNIPGRLGVQKKAS